MLPQFQDLIDLTGPGAMWTMVWSRRAVFKTRVFQDRGERTTGKAESPVRLRNFSGK